jgi:hypothetical protein
MYGRVMDDIQLQRGPYGAPAPPLSTGVLNHLRQQLDVDVGAGANQIISQLARIYAFSFGGDLYTLTTPTIFLVHGPGGDPNVGAPGGRFSKTPGSADNTGVATQDYDFAEDIRVWTYDKNDISLRLDLSTGMLEDILLAAEFGDDMEHPSFGGGKVGGGKVGGGKVGGGKVGGGKVGGG